MQTVQYTRSTGRQLTYSIRADEFGRYTIHLGDKELLRGRDSLAAGGRHRAGNKRKMAGAIAEAQRAIEQLTHMEEC
ncbi:hypothetical protein H8N03_04750 [Ramlibacter sp. USB13]|uniref:Uncharacterized protein n=1 Tax=Ramlibacter cellulosilyticus TaxID=2764187 RepID=A0A923MR12_9BURK|nr:hypothetical protein [Ramlibacter cellulosilyticus]MBC5782242.1 hypothetical protein [Ramlibacter cellulosilyticus]